MSLEDAVGYQPKINKFLAENNIKDLVGDYGEILVQKSLGVTRQNAVNRGYDIRHDFYKRIEVKTRKYELKQDRAVPKENRAVKFEGKESNFDWLTHVILDADLRYV